MWTGVCRNCRPIQTGAADIRPFLVSEEGQCLQNTPRRSNSSPGALTTLFSSTTDQSLAEDPSGLGLPIGLSSASSGCIIVVFPVLYCTIGAVEYVFCFGQIHSLAFPPLR